MNAAELLDQLNREGADIALVDGQPRLRGAKVSSELREALRTHRDELVLEVQRRMEVNVQRYGEVPPTTAGVVALEFELPEAQRQAIMHYVMRQPRPVHAWVMGRATGYFEQGIPADDCEWRACLDVVAWQRACTRTTAVTFVLALPASADIGL